MNRETEYQVINAWRNSKVQQHDTVSSLVLTIAALTFFSSFTYTDFKQLPIAAWFFTNIVVIVWRVWGRYHNLAIIGRYPRIVKLEVQLGYTFTREYLREKWWPNRSPEALPTHNDVTGRIERYEGFHWWERWFIAYYFLFRDRGHLCWDILASLFVIITSGVIVLYLGASWYVLILVFFFTIIIIIRFRKRKVDRLVSY